MCSVNGMVLLNSANAKEAAREFAKLMMKASDRGRDSYGLVLLGKEGIRSFRRAGTPGPELEEWLLENIDGKTIVVANNRAEPTTEVVKEKRESDIQPFESGRYVVSHNGVVANDQELERQFEIKKRSRIDSSILPPLLERTWDGTLEGLRNVLDMVRGSFAMIVGDAERPDRLVAAVNFKPMYFEVNYDLGAIFVSSLDDYLPRRGKHRIERVMPYSVMEFLSDGSLKRVELLRREVKRVLMVASGGLDSTVAATKLIRDGYEVTLLHFNYRHKAERREVEAIREVARRLSLPLIEVDTDLFKIVGSTPLIDGEVRKDRGGEEGAEFAHEWVPARNLVFTSVAIAIAEARGYDAVALGVNLEEAGAYPDNEMEFVRLLNALSPYATGPNKRVDVLMPVGNLVKHEIVKLGVQLNAPLDATWSCYEGGERHCGRCGPCYMRRKAFEVNGLVDPVPYKGF